MSKRARRIVTVASLTLPLLACSARQLEAPHPQPQAAQDGVWLQNPQLKLDIVFGIDDSDSMKEEQANLVANFPTFMRVLQESFPAGSLDAHIAVVSSDLGVASPGVGGCNTAGGDNGAFQSVPRGACAGPQGSYIITGPAGNNFTGSIEEVFSCIAPLGIKGCGFEHQVGAVRRALGGDPDVGMPPENAGFLRDDARLGVILITDEDDCSAPLGTDLFTPDTSVYGPVNSYRCNEYGHLCGGAPPPRAVASGLACQSNETDTTRLVKVADFVRFFRELKRNPNLLRFAAIAGPPGPYATHVEPTKGNAIEINPSCTSSAGSAAPAVRLAELVSAFGDRGLFETICRDDFGPAMEHIARALGEIPPPCVTGLLYDRDVQAAGIQPDCTVSESSFDGAGGAHEAAVPSCDDNGGVPPCWRLAADPTACASAPDHMLVSIDHGADHAAPNTGTRWSCRVCPASGGPGCAR